jgi:hypothetical protein
MLESAWLGYVSPTDITWANFDVLNEDGTVYLGATIPLPVALFESGTWDFNGTKLPYLPTWDMETYPYAAIFYISITKKYILRCLTVDAHYEMPSLVANSGISCSTTGDVWSEFGENTTDAYIPINVSIQPLVWTNFVAEYDGITYMTASDPIPVYE